MAPDTLTPTKTTQIFFTKQHNLRLIRCAGYPSVSPAGHVTDASPGLHYEFDPQGYLMVDDELRARDENFFEKYGHLYGKSLDTRPAEEWLRDHRRFNLEGEGFVEMERSVPESGPIMGEILDATLERNEDRLLEIYTAEEEGDERPDVLDAAKKALAQLEAGSGD